MKVNIGSDLVNNSTLWPQVWYLHENYITHSKCAHKKIITQTSGGKFLPPWKPPPLPSMTLHS